jgi:hypothetical protein
MSQSTAHQQTGLILVLGAALLAFAVKCAWALNSFGTSDLFIFSTFAKQLAETGLAETYRNNSMFNHTPLTALLLRGLYAASKGDFAAFASGFRIITALADLGSVAALLFVQRRTARPAWWVLALFAASPVSIMVSGFHGNVDPLMVLFLLSAVAMLVARRPVLCGILFALACQVKIVPVLLAPLFLGWWWQSDRQALVKFTGAAAVATLAGWAVALVQCPGAFLHNVFGYASYWGTWGFTYWLHQTGADVFKSVSFKGLSDAQNWVSFGLKSLMALGVLTLAWRRRKVGGAEFFTSLTAAFAVLFVFAPGAGPQYLVWIAPFLAWSLPRWYVAVTLCSSVYMVAFYHSTAKYEFPWELSFPKGGEIAVWGPWMNVAWGAFILLLATQARHWWHPAPAVPLPVISGGDTPAAA